MELTINYLNDLSSQQVTQMFLERVKVFVVEQNCPYQEVDVEDFEALHVLMKENDNLVAYARVITKPDAYYIGRVLVVKDYRRKGLGSKLVQAILDYLDTDKPIRLSGQTYVAQMYEKLGFVQVSEEYLEDNIPHIDMELDLSNM